MSDGHQQSDAARIRTILSAPEAVQRPALARKIAFDTALTAEDAILLLREAPLDPDEALAFAEAHLPRPQASAFPPPPAAAYGRPYGHPGEAPPMGMGEAVSRFFSGYFTFSGRARRAEYWWSVLFLVLAGLVLGVVDGFLFTDLVLYGDVAPLTSLFNLATLIPTFALCARRLHDIGRSGWWVLTPFLPLLLLFPALFAGFIISMPAPGQPVLTLMPLMLAALLSFGLVITIFIWTLQRSQSGSNLYGPSPLEA